jgi:hypothetical protein
MRHAIVTMTVLMTCYALMEHAVLSHSHCSRYSNTYEGYDLSVYCVLGFLYDKDQNTKICAALNQTISSGEDIQKCDLVDVCSYTINGYKFEQGCECGFNPDHQCYCQ